MASPHPVGALCPIQRFTHPAYVYGRRNTSLPKLTLLFLQSFHSKYVHICYAPTSGIHVCKQQHVYICMSFLHTLSKTSHFPELTISCSFSFCFLFFGVSWVMFPIDVSKHCSSASSASFVLQLFFRPFSHVGVICKLMMHPVMLFNSAAFLINTYCDGSMDLSNHDPFFDQLKFYYP